MNALKNTKKFSTATQANACKTKIHWSIGRHAFHDMNERRDAMRTMHCKPKNVLRSDGLPRYMI